MKTARMATMTTVLAVVLSLTGSSSAGTITLNFPGQVPADIGDLSTVSLIEMAVSAPPGSTVTDVEYQITVAYRSTPRVFACSDYVIDIGPLSGTVRLWNKDGGATDQGLDNDPEDDSDIELSGHIDSFNGQSPNQVWCYTVSDVVEENVGRLASASITIHYQTRPDLTMCPSPEWSFSPQSVAGGQSFQVRCSVINNGDGAAGPFRVRFYASSDSTITSSDYEIGSVTKSGLIGGGIMCLQCAWSGTFPTSIPPGSYYLGCIIDADNQVTEGDETNNTGYAGSMLTALATVPGVVGMTESATGSAITSAGLVVGTKTFQCSATVPAGNVISQSPAGGTSAPPGSAVNLTLSTGPCEVTVPNVVGATESSAQSAILKYGLVVGTKTYQCSNTVPSGSVISQSPAAGTPVASGSAVNLTISSGPCQATVPNVVGMTELAAGSAITSAGLVVGTKTPQCSNTVPSGSVISQSPAAGTSVASGSAVNLTISSGPCQATVPNVVGMTESAAGSAITSGGLVVGTKTPQCSNTVPSGSVISQSPAAGTSVSSGSAVNLTISSGPCQGNHPPVAKDDSASVAPGRSIAIDVLSNDSDPDGDRLTITGVTQPQHGTVTYTEQAATYTGARAWKGTDTFTYTISDGHGGTATAKVTVTVAVVNHPPVAVNDSATTSRSTPVTVSVLANDTDPDNDPLTITSVTVAPHGTVTHDGQTVTYTPNRLWEGVDTFTYTISDGRGGTATATVTVTVTVTVMNHPPVANDDLAATARDTPVTIPVLANDSDPDNNLLTVTSAATPAHGSVAVALDGQTATYTPSQGWTGTDTFTYTISDGKGGTATATVTVATVDVLQQRPQVVTDAQFRQQKVAGVLVPVCMYYVERYFGGMRQTEMDQTIAAILDNSPAGREAFQIALVNYYNMSADEKSQRYDGDVVQATSSVDNTLDASFIQGKLKDADPEMVVDLDAPPAAPSELTATNNSPYIGAEIFQPGGGHQIKLTWRDNSDEAGFRIYRSHTTSTGTGAWVVGLIPELVATVGPDVTTYIDKLGLVATPCTNTDQYCYYVTAYKNPFIALPGAAPGIIESEYSNPACAGCARRSQPPCPDPDLDGVCDDAWPWPDLCPNTWGLQINYGCPDSDGDHAPEKPEVPDPTNHYTDMCPGIPGQPPGKLVPPGRQGCPTRYVLKWMKMEVLNNTYQAKSCLGYDTGDPYDNEIRNDNGYNWGWDCAEEPYLIFTVANGLPKNAGWTAIVRAVHWCCGEGVDLNYGISRWEPDLDPFGEEHPESNADLWLNGMTVFPSEGGFGEIDPTTGLAVTVILMERDYDVTIPVNEVEKWKATAELELAIRNRVQSAAGNQGKLAGLMAELFEHGLTVRDPDDLQGVDVWRITATEAYNETYGDGVYAFYFEMPSTYKVMCGNYGTATCAGKGIITSMRARVYFCLFREGTEPIAILKACMNPTHVDINY